MSYIIKKNVDRHTKDHGWLKTSHTFSFGEYYDPEWMGFRSLRVINEDQIAPGKGFPSHQHKDMEIISLVLEGQLAHKDSMGTESIIHVNEMQTMSAGTGISHSEYNPSKTKAAHFLQIWIIPDKKGIEPRYQQEVLHTQLNEGKLVVSPFDKKDVIKIHQNVNIYIFILEPGKIIDKVIPNNRFGWLQVIEGSFLLNQDHLTNGDGVAIEPNTNLQIRANTLSKFLFFDLA